MVNLILDKWIKTINFKGEISIILIIIINIALFICHSGWFNNMASYICIKNYTLKN